MVCNTRCMLVTYVKDIGFLPQKIFSLCKNISISKIFVSKLSFKQTAGFSLKTTTTVIKLSTCSENHVSSL